MIAKVDKRFDKMQSKVCQEELHRAAMLDEVWPNVARCLPNVDQLFVNKFEKFDEFNILY